MFRLKNIQKALFVFIVVFAAYAAFSIYSNAELSIDDFSIEKQYNAQRALTGLSTNKKDYSVFLRKINKSNIFAAPVIKKKDRSKEKELERVKSLVKSLRLVGVFGEDKRKAVIENTKTSSTLYAYVGDTILGSLKVKDVSSSTVVLAFDTTEFRLDM